MHTGNYYSSSALSPSLTKPRRSWKYCTFRAVFYCIEILLNCIREFFNTNELHGLEIWTAGRPLAAWTLPIYIQLVYSANISRIVILITLPHCTLNRSELHLLYVAHCNATRENCFIFWRSARVFCVESGVVG